MAYFVDYDKEVPETTVFNPSKLMAQISNLSLF